MFLVAAEELKRHAGVCLNKDKSGILLPPNAPLLDVSCLPLGSVVSHTHVFVGDGPDRHKVELKRDGMIVVGAAVGSDDFVRRHIMGVVLRATRKLAALSLLDAQNALLLLSGCLSTALTYHLQVTPPRLAAAAAQAWDDAMDAARARIMSEPSVGVVPVVGPALQALSDGKARLPLKKGGLGHTSAAMLSPAAFYATYTQHAFHEQVGPDRMLVQELDFARALLTPSLPQAALELLADPCVMRLKAPPVKLQRSITQALQTRAHAALMDSAPDDRDKRIIAKPTDAFLPFLVLPTMAGLVLDHRDYIAGMRFYLLLPQLLRTPRTVTVDPPVAGVRDFSYQADACRHCRDQLCDRHLVHAHACNKSSKPKIKDRHDKVKLVRVELVKEAGYSGVLVEPSFAAMGARADLTQRRGDVFFRDESKLVHIHYVTDDVVVHPLSATYMDHGERVDHSHALGEAVRKKEKLYDSALTMMRSAGACRAGLRKVTFLPCAFTSLGGLSEPVVKFLNGAAGFLKACETAAALRRLRDDGLTPQLLSKRFRFRARALLQAAILQGNGSIAYSVGL